MARKLLVTVRTVTVSHYEVDDDGQLGDLLPTPDDLYEIASELYHEDSDALLLQQECTHEVTEVSEYSHDKGHCLGCGMPTTLCQCQPVEEYEL